MKDRFRNPITRDFPWDTLYERYDATCRRFDPNSPSLYAFSERPASDRELYYATVDRAKHERSITGCITAGTYEAILYWKLYSQPAAIWSTCRRIQEDRRKQEEIRSFAASMKQWAPDRMARDISAVRRLLRELGRQHPLPCGLADACALPMRSTLLHFLYPDVIPVFDKQVLRAFGITEPGANRRLEYLWAYVERAWEISEDTELIPRGWKESPLRLLDMASWVDRGRG